MRIAFVSEHYPPTDGGVATSTRRVARALVATGFEVSVFCFDHSREMSVDDYCLREVDEGVHVHRLGPFFLKQKLSVDSVAEKHKAILRRRFLGQVIRLVDSSYDVVLSFYLLNAGFLAQMLANAKKLPHVTSVRGNDVGRNIFNVERFAAIQWVLSSASRIVCVNEHLHQRALLVNRQAEARMMVIHNSVPSELILHSDQTARGRISAVTGWNEHDLRITFVGTMREKKGVSTLLRAIETANLRNRVNLLVVGPELSGIERQFVDREWENLKASGRLFCTGWVDRSQVAGWVQGADCVVMPSLDDGMANGLIESIALGLCPIVSDIFDDVVVDGVTGIVTPVGDSALLADALLRAAADRGALSRMASEAKLRVSRYTPRDEAIAYGIVLQEAVENALKY